MTKLLGENEYIMEWSTSDKEKVSVVYFDNTLNEDVIQKYVNDEVMCLTSMQIYSQTVPKKIDNIDLRNIIVKVPAGMFVKDHIALIAALSKAFRYKNAVLYLNNTYNYEMIEEILKDFIKVKKINLFVVIQKPFLIEGGKKIKQSNILQDKYKMYPM